MVLFLTASVWSADAGGQPAAEASVEVDMEAAMLLAAASVEAAFGPSQVADITPYFDPGSFISVYAVEFTGEGNKPVTAIVSAWRDDVPVMQMPTWPLMVLLLSLRILRCRRPMLRYRVPSSLPLKNG